MKLRNKKTGQIKSIEEIIRDAFLSNELDSLKSIDTNWEEIEESREPLIKDKEARKIIKDFAARCGVRTFVYCQEDFTLRGANTDCRIGFGAIMSSFNLKDREGYYVAELCGEEEQ